MTADRMNLFPADHRIIEKHWMEFQPFGRTADSKKIDDVSGVSMRVYVNCLEETVMRKRGGEAARRAVDELVALLNECIKDPSYHVTPTFLKNPWNSYSHEFSLFLTNFCSLLAEDPEFHVKVGKKLVPRMIRTLGRPFSVQQIFKMAAHFGAKYVKAIHFEPIKIEESCAILRISYSENSLRQFGAYRSACVSEICATIKAACSTVPEAVHDLLPATVKDLACVANGDAYCEWEIRWQAEKWVSVSWWATAIGTAAAMSIGLTFVRPPLSLVEILLLSLMPTLLVLALHNRYVLRKELRRRGEIIDEQAVTTDTRHEELREAYLEQEQRTADLRRKVSELMMLHETGLSLTSTRALTELISSVLGTLIKWLHFDRVVLGFYDARSSVLKDAWVLSASETDAEHLDLEAPIVEPGSLQGGPFLSERPVLATDVKEILPQLPSALRQLFSSTGGKAVIAVPLKVKNQLVGMIMADRSGTGSLTEEYLAAMSTFANQLAMGLDNVRAYHEIEELNVGLEAKVRQRTAELETANSQLKELDNLKSQFLALVSHDLRTPLTVIQSFADNLLDQMAGPLTDRQHQYLKRITVNSGRLRRMISNLLDQSRIEAGKIELSHANVPLRQLAEDVIEQMKPLAEAREQTLTVYGGPDLAVWGDEVKLHQVVTNLVDNAIKYTPPKGSIRVTIGLDVPTAAKLSVIDSGDGIPAAAQPKLFDLFYRVDNVQRQHTKGFGVGLSIVKTFVELHGGRVIVESEEGKGAAFHVTLPLAPQTAVPTEARPKVQRILLVDDDPDIRQFVTERLERAGDSVWGAKTGRQALEMIASGQFDGLVLDIGLPELNGIEVLKSVRAQRLTMPVLIITAAEARDEAMQAVEGGAQAYLLKPFIAGQFERVVAQCFERGICHDPQVA